MPASSPPLPAASLLALVVAAAACRFAPDLSAYAACGAGGECPAGQTCLASEGICVACRAEEAGCAGADAGAVGEDAGNPGDDAGAGPDAGPVPDTGSLRLETETLEVAKEGEPYLQILQAAGGAAPYTFSVASGGLPVGLTLTDQGTLSGIPTEAGSAAFFVQVTDKTSQVAAKAFTLPVNPATGEALRIVTEALAEGQVAAAYTMDLEAGGGLPPYQWNVASGALPLGLALNQAGSIFGIPSEPGETTLELRVVDASTPTKQAALRSFALRINPTQGQALAIQTTAVPDGEVGVAYSAQLAVEGGTAPYTWGLAAGSSLPSGLTLSTAGIISGTPKSAGAVSFIAQVVDSSEPAQTSSRTLALSIAAGDVPPLSITTSSLPEGTVQVAYAASLATSGGTPPVTFSSTALPAGLALSSTGSMSGTPTAAGIFNVSVTARDSSSPAQTATRGYTLTIGTGTSAPPLAVATSTLPSGTALAAYSQTLAATGGTMPYQWSLASGALPPGLSLAASGAISGTATMPGAFTFTAKVGDSSEPQQQASRGLTLNVIPAPLALDTASLPDATFGTAYSADVRASGGTQPYLFTVKTGTLPKGLTLCESGACAGRISGTPQARSSNNFSIEVTDASAPTKSAIANYSIDVL